MNPGQVLRPYSARISAFSLTRVRGNRRCSTNSYRGEMSLPPAPSAGQLVEHDGVTYTTVREGRAHILIPANVQISTDPRAKEARAGDHKDGDHGQQRQNVFYNPIQQFNRDLSVLAIKAFAEDWSTRRLSMHEKKKQAKLQLKRKQQTTKRKLDDSDRGTDGARQTEKEDKNVKTAQVGQGLAKKPRMSSGRETEEIGQSIGPAEQSTERDADDVGASRLEAANETNTREASCVSRASCSHQPHFRILDALSATGLRALRYAKEIPQVTSIVANDMNPVAIDSMKINIQHNGLEADIIPNVGNAIGYLYSVAYPPTSSHGPQHASQKFAVIDLDPYGTAAPFLDAALQALDNGGLLCVTCTDSGVFASCGYAEKTYALYGGMPVKGPHAHEGGLRLIINSIASIAARYGMAIEPLLSLSIDYYVRTFVRVRKSPADVKFLASKTMVVYGCDAGCGAWSTQMLGRAVKQSNKSGSHVYKHSVAQAPSCDRLCEHCGSKTHVAGPMWAGPLHNGAFVEKILADLEHADAETYQTKPRIEGMLNTVLEELLVNDGVTEHDPLTTSTDETAFGNHNDSSSYSADSSGGPINQKSLPRPVLIPVIPAPTIDRFPFFLIPSAICKVIHCVAPPDTAVRGALRGLGYRATRSHCQPGSIKTNAPWNVIWEMMREWVRQRSPLKENALKENTAGWRIMQASRVEANARIEEHRSAETASVDGQKAIAEMETAGVQVEVPVAEISWPAKIDVRKLSIVFNQDLGKDRPGKRLVRYQINPRENWGPMAKARGKA